MSYDHRNYQTTDMGTTITGRLRERHDPPRHGPYHHVTQSEKELCDLCTLDYTTIEERILAHMKEKTHD